MIVTVGVSPVWDLTCVVNGVEWGEHARMESMGREATGKALNVSKALARMGRASVAAGLWGEADWDEMQAALAAYAGVIRPAFTRAAGRTRENVTVVDTRGRREMHLRSTSSLATREALAVLRKDLAGLIDSRATVVFSGSLPEGELLEDCVELIAEAGQRAGVLAADTSGEGLRRVVERGGIEVIKPNLEELSELLGREAPCEAGAVAAAARELLGPVRTVVVSLGEAGAVAVTKEEAVWCRAAGRGEPAAHTVGCGDVLLAGFVGTDGGLGERLAAGVRAATARARGGLDTFEILSTRFETNSNDSMG